MKIFPDIDDQIATMRKRFADFRVIRRWSDRAIWRGPLTPILKTHEIEIAYRVPMVVERLDLLRLQPRVRVIDPPLKPRHGDVEGRLPHVYWIDDAPFLCLFDPGTREWTPDALLCDTTVKYASDWLACYEGWRATGIWTGGGRHLQVDAEPKGIPQ